VMQCRWLSPNQINLPVIANTISPWCNADGCRFEIKKCELLVGRRAIYLGFKTKHPNSRCHFISAVHAPLNKVRNHEWENLSILKLAHSLQNILQCVPTQSTRQLSGALFHPNLLEHTPDSTFLCPFLVAIAKNNKHDCSGLLPFS
jgi:hypothetical protein